MVYGTGAPSSPVKVQSLESAEPGHEAPLGEPPSPWRVGLLLPLSGPHAHEGQHMLNAAMMSVYDWNKPIELYPVDTQGTPEGARSAYHHLHQRGVSMILGPLFASEMKGLYQEADKPLIIAFSNDAQESPPAPFFRLGAFAHDTIKTLVGFGLKKRIKKWAVIVPTSPHGKTLEHLILESLRHHHQDAAFVVRYETLKDDTPFQSLRGAAVEGWIITETGPRFEALMHHLDPFKHQNLTLALVGPWTEDLAHKTALPREAILALPSLEGTRAFRKRYETLFHEPPSSVTPYVYDSLSLVALLRNKVLTPDLLSDPQGFDGIQGAFRFTDRRAQRLLGVFHKTAQGLQALEPVPHRF